MNHRFQQENWMWSQCVDGWQEPRLAVQNAHYFPVAVCYVAKELKSSTVGVICILYLYKHRIRLVGVAKRHQGAMEYEKRASRLRDRPNKLEIQGLSEGSFCLLILRDTKHSLDFPLKD